MNISNKLSKFLEIPRPILIGGNWIQPSHLKWMPTLNPADGEAIGEYCIAGLQEIDQAVS